MALMDVLRLFDLNPEKIAAITADGVPAMTGKMNRMKEKKATLSSQLMQKKHLTKFQVLAIF